jgi:aspartyl-tRNA(Asn)/glutamyl-tRNA(Gln) amidotransferase subunit C
MSLTEKEVRHVAVLARLHFEEEEVEKVASQLSSILGYIDKLAELDTDNVEPTFNPLEIRNVFRADKVTEKFEAGVWHKNAPEEEKNHLRVPKVLEG